MSHNPPEKSTPLSPDALCRIDALCQEYEATWKSWKPQSGPTPQVEPYLAREADPVAQARLHEELRAIEEDYRPVWYSTRHDGRSGPTSLRELRKLAVEHMLDPEDPLQQDGWEKAKPACAVIEGDGVFLFAGHKIRDVLGKGGMGVVFKATQISLNRLVALKMIRSERLASHDAAQRFKDEAENVARLEHPNIVHVHQFGEERGKLYFSQEFVDGGTLAGRKREFCLPDANGQHSQEGPPERWSRGKIRGRLQAIAELVMTLARAMHYAHQRGIVHQDLKPLNVLLTLEQVPKIADFGLAKQLHAEGDEPIGGTPEYMAKEQADLYLAVFHPSGDGRDNEQIKKLRARIDSRTDIYALGAILYELLTGRPPLTAGHNVSTVSEGAFRTEREQRAHFLDMVRTQEPVAPRKRNPRVPTDLEAICLKCLEKDAEKRYQSAEMLAEELRRFAALEPVQARPGNKRERLWKWCRRKPVIAALTVALMLLAIGAFLWDRIRTSSHVDELTDQIRQTDKAKTLAQLNEKMAEKRRGEADLARGVAEKEAGQNLQRFIRMTIATSEQMMAEGDLFGSLLYAAEALAKDDKNSPQAKIHPLRVAAALRQSPKLMQVWSHAQAVTSVLFSPDGNKVLTASADGTARLWDAATGEPALPQALTHGGAINHAAFSPDGKHIATAGEDHTARVWDSGTGKMLHELKLRQPAFQVAFKPIDGKYVLAVSGDKYAGSFTRTSSPTTTTTPGRLIPGSPIQIPGPMQRIMTGIGPGGVPQYSMIPGPMRTIPGPMQYVPGITHTTPGITQHVQPHGDVGVFDVNTGEAVGAPIRQEGWINAAAFHPDGNQVITAGGSSTGKRFAELWDVPAPKRAEARRRLPHSFDVHWAVFSPDGTQVVTATGPVNGTTGEAQVWDVASQQRVGQPMRHGAAVTQAWFSADGRRVLTASADETARVWNAATGEPITPSPLRHRDRIVGAWFSPDGRAVLTASWDGTARVWNATSGELLSPSLKHASRLTAAAFDGDGRRVLTAARDGEVRLWDLAGASASAVFKHVGLVKTPEVGVVHQFPLGNRLVRSKQPLPGVVAASAVFGPDNDYVVTGAGGRVLDLIPGGREASADADIQTHHLCVWNLTDGKLVRPPLPHHAAVTAGNLSPDGRLFVTLGGEGVQLWETTTGKAMALALEAKVYGATFRHDGRCCVVTAKPPDLLPNPQASSTSFLQVLDLLSRKPLVPPLEYQGQLQRAALSRDGSKLVVLASTQLPATKKEDRQFDWVVQAWDLNDNGRPFGQRLQPSRWITQLEVSPTGEHVITYRPSASGTPSAALGRSEPNQEGEAQLWHLRTGRMVALKHAGVVTHVGFSRDGRQVVTASADRTARVWDLEGRPLSPPLEHRARINHAALAGNGLIVTASNDHSARVWHVATGEPVSPPLKHDAPVLHAAFSADDSRLVTSDLVGTTRVWNLSPDVRNPEEIKRLAELLACHRLDPAGGLTGLDRLTRAEIWQDLRRRYPEEFAVSPRQVVAWQQQAEDAERAATARAAGVNVERVGFFPKSELPASPALFSFQGRLTGSDPLDVFPLTRKSRHKVHEVQLEAGKAYQIDLQGNFDTFLRVEDAKKEPLVHNDDVLYPKLNSRLIFTPPSRQAYRLIATSFEPGATGDYTLQVREAIPLGDPQTIAAELTEKDPQTKGKHVKTHEINLVGGSPYTLEVETQHFMPVLRLADSKGILPENEHTAPDKRQRSRIDVTPAEDASFRLLVTAGSGQTGGYTLRVQRYGLKPAHGK